MKIKLSGPDLLRDPRLNKGTVFIESERDTFALHGLLPPHIGTLDDQRDRRHEWLSNLTTPIEKCESLRDLQDANKTLFYSLTTNHVEEGLSIVCTTTVGESCQKFSQIRRNPRELFLSFPEKHRIDRILSDARYDDVSCIVVSDGRHILDLGYRIAGGRRYDGNHDGRHHGRCRNKPLRSLEAADTPFA
jgi:malate dehydrogenase (oxaloacetate-decarboxylating)